MRTADMIMRAKLVFGVEGWALLPRWHLASGWCLATFSWNGYPNQSQCGNRLDVVYLCHCKIFAASFITWVYITTYLGWY